MISFSFHMYNAHFELFGIWFKRNSFIIFWAGLNCVAFFSLILFSPSFHLFHTFIMLQIIKTLHCCFGRMLLLMLEVVKKKLHIVSCQMQWNRIFCRCYKNIALHMYILSRKIDHTNYQFYTFALYNFRFEYLRSTVIGYVSRYLCYIVS